MATPVSTFLHKKDDTCMSYPVNPTKSPGESPFSRLPGKIGAFLGGPQGYGTGCAFGGAPTAQCLPRSFLQHSPSHVTIKTKRLLAPVLLTVVLFATGCAASAQSPVTGSLYADAQGPVAATANTTSPETPRVGRASATSILGLLGTGDASIQAAMENGDISEIHYVDYKATNLLGLYAEYTVVVHGE